MAMHPYVYPSGLAIDDNNGWCVAEQRLAAQTRGQRAGKVARRLVGHARILDEVG